MIRHAFPDLSWLKNEVVQWNADGRGWPTLILNASAENILRPDVKGPLSVFLNISGTSHASVHGRRAQVDESVYFLTNPEQHYTLEINSPQPVETFNIHLGHSFADKVLHSAISSTSYLLEHADDASSSIAFFNKLYPRDNRFNALVATLHAAGKAGVTSGLWYEERLALIVHYLLERHCDILRTISSLPPVKATTRTEVYRRLSLAVDYIYEHYRSALTLDELASAACLSKFHFLRLFREAFRTTPYQFISQVRVQRACDLLRSRLVAVHDIAEYLGFENPASFSRVFRNHTGMYPSRFRAQ